MNFLLCEPVFNSQYAICDALSKNCCYTPPLLRTNTHRAHLERKKTHVSTHRNTTDSYTRTGGSTHAHGCFHFPFFFATALSVLYCATFSRTTFVKYAPGENPAVQSSEMSFFFTARILDFFTTGTQWKQVTMMVAAAAPFGNCKPFSTYAAQNTWTLGCVQKHAGELVKPFFYFFLHYFCVVCGIKTANVPTKQKPSKSSDNSVNCLNCKTSPPDEAKVKQTTVWSSQKSLATDSLFFTFGHFRVNFAHCCVLLFLHKAAKALEVGYSLLSWSTSNGIFLYEIIIRLNSLEVMVISLRFFFFFKPHLARAHTHTRHNAIRPTGKSVCGN